MKFRQALFWDTDPRRIDPRKHARYIIERVLELGEPGEVAWVLGRYSKREIRKVMALPRAQISPRSKALWSLLLKKRKS